MSARPWKRSPVPPRHWLDWWGRLGQYELRAILMTGWDPIGVAADEATPWSEYDSYLEEIAEALRLGEGAESVERRLAKIERVSMGFEGEFALRRTNLGEVLVAWHRWSYVQRGREIVD